MLSRKVGGVHNIIKEIEDVHKFIKRYFVSGTFRVLKEKEEKQYDAQRL
jgi:hypothetical protein